MVIRRKIKDPVIMQLLTRQNNKCKNCGTPLVDRNFHLDHIKNLSNGGENSFDNYQLLCIRCHKKKTNDENFNFNKNSLEIITNVCSFCGKVLEGFNKIQVDYQLLQHKLSKHPDKIKVEEIPDGILPKD